MTDPRHEDAPILDELTGVDSIEYFEHQLGPMEYHETFRGAPAPPPGPDRPRGAVAGFRDRF